MRIRYDDTTLQCGINKKREREREIKREREREENKS